jgi:hypothetical protein
MDHRLVICVGRCDRSSTLAKILLTTVHKLGMDGLLKCKPVFFLFLPRVDLLEYTVAHNMAYST